MVITLIGHIYKYKAANDSDKECFGGIITSLLTLANLMSDKHKIQPVFGIGGADYDTLIEILNPYKNIDISGIYKIKAPTCQFVFYGDKIKDSQIEKTQNISQPIPFNKIKPYLDGDGVLINMISGSDITLETLDYIRMETREKSIPIYFDFNSLTLGIDQNNKRFQRSITDWRRWCFMLNVIQMNEEEAIGLSSERFDEKTLINHLMPLMVETLIITRGEKGVTVIVQDIHKKLTQENFIYKPVEKVRLKIGCGEVFGATFFYQYLKTKDNFISAEYANKAAGLFSTFNDIYELNNFEDKLEKNNIIISKQNTNGKNNNGIK